MKAGEAKVGMRVRLTIPITEYAQRFNLQPGALATITRIVAQNEGATVDAVNVHPDSYAEGWDLPIPTYGLEAT